MSFYNKRNSYADQQVFKSACLVHMCQCTSIFVCIVLTLSISYFFDYVYTALTKSISLFWFKYLFGLSSVDVT